MEIWALIILFGIFTGALIVGLFKGGTEPSYDNLKAQEIFFEVRRLYFAAGILGLLMFLLVAGIAVCTWGPRPEGGGDGPGKLVFDSIIQVVPPIITLVLGFYFGQQSVSKPTSEQQPPQQQQTTSQTRSEPESSTSSATSGTAAFGQGSTVPDIPQQSETQQSEKPQSVTL